MKQKRMILFFFWILLFSVGCPLKKEPIKIGFIGVLTGDQSEIALYCRTAVTIAIDEINEQGGLLKRNLVLVVKDNKGDPALQGQLVKELIDEGAVLIVGPTLSAMMASSLHSLENRNALMISPTVSTDLINGRDDNFLKFSVSARGNGKSIGQLILRELQQIRIAIIYDGSNKEYSSSLLEGFYQVLGGSGKEIVSVQEVLNEEGQYLRIAEECEASDPDAVLLITSAVDTAMLAQQFRKLNSSTQLYGSLWSKTGRLIEMGGVSVEGMIFADVLKSTSASERYGRFEREVSESYKQDLIFPHSFAYDSVMVLADAIRMSKSTDPRIVKRTILETAGYQTYNGVVFFDQYGDVVREYSAVRIQNGLYVSEKMEK